MYTTNISNNKPPTPSRPSRARPAKLSKRVDKPLSLTGLVRVFYRVGVGVGSGDVEVDIIYMPIMMTAQYTGLLGTVQRLTLQQLRIQLNIRARLIKSESGVFKPFPCGVTNIYRCQLLRICDDTTSKL